MEEDKRRCVRLNIELPASFKVHKSQEHISHASSLDVSALGLRLLTREPLEKGQIFPIRIILPDQQRLTLTVEVVWAKREEASITEDYLAGVRIVTGKQPEDETKYVKFFAKEFLNQQKPPAPEKG